MFSYLWPSSETNEKTTEEAIQYFPSVQAKTLFATISASSPLVCASKLKGQSLSPTIAAGAGVGTPTVLTVSGTDTAGLITVTTGTAAASNTLLTVTFSSAYTSIPNVVFSQSNEVSGTHFSRVYCVPTTTGFSLVGSSVALSDATQYKWNYIVVQ